MTIRPVLFWLAAGALSANLRADVTILTKSDSRRLQSLPLGLSDPFTSLPPSSPMSFRVKGAKGVGSTGNFTTITDLAKQEITLIDGSKKIFATFPMQEYKDRMAAAMPQSSPRTALKMRAKALLRQTGRTETIQGIQAEEREMTLSLETEILNAGPQSGPLIRCVWQIWTAKPEEMLSVPALREFAGFAAVQNHFANPVEMLQKVATQMTGTAEGMDAVIEGMRKVNSVVLRSALEIYMPGLGAMAEKLALQRGQPITDGFDPNAPFSRTTQEVVGISTGPVEDDLFQIPAGYVAGPVEELMKSLIPSASRVAH
jgi:hypothetical protein